MSVASLASLPTALGLSERPYVYLVGGGGKTTLMFTLARLLVARGHTVVTSTSTRIWRPDDHPVVLGAEPVERVRAALATARHVTVAAGEEGEKLVGFSPSVLDELWSDLRPDVLLVEADGSRGRPLKGHAPHEPVVSANASQLIAVVGADAVGSPLDENHVHRAAIAGRLLGLPLGRSLAVEPIARLLEHPAGMLRNLPADMPVAAVVTRGDRGPATLLAARLAAGRFAPVVACELCGDAPWVGEVLAADSSS